MATDKLVNQSQHISSVVASEEFSGAVRFLFYIFVIYLVIPVIDLPLLGLSLSAPILFLLFLSVFFRPNRIRLSKYKYWILVAYVFWFGILLSLVGNGLFSAVNITSADISLLTRYGYLQIAFFTTLIIISNTDWLNTLGIIIGIGILLLAGLRLFEAVAFGRWGAWTSPEFLPQNTYGIQFSTFIPFAIVLPFILRGQARILSIIALIFAVAAIAGNGSRTSWIGVAVGVSLFLLIYAATQQSGLRSVPARIIPLIVVLIAIISILPASILTPITSRLDTFNSLDDDKSFAIRQLMIEKGERLFLANPVFGVGVGRFRISSVPLDIPAVLSYSDQEHFDVKSPQNSYFQTLAETGVFGTAPFLFLQIFLVIKGFPATIRFARRGQIWAIAIFTGYVGMSIHLWTLAGLQGTAPWFVYGLVAGLIERDRHLQAETAA